MTNATSNLSVDAGQAFSPLKQPLGQEQGSVKEMYQRVSLLSSVSKKAQSFANIIMAAMGLRYITGVSHFLHLLPQKISLLAQPCYQ